MANRRRIFFIFPGQGSQYRGMGSDLVEEFDRAGEVFVRASEVAGYDMAELCFEDPQQRLDRTRYTQPAVLTHEVACLEALQSLVPDIRPAMTAGHSLGEYAALIVGGALSFEDALRLVIRRAELMSEFGQGGMLATALDLGSARALADRHFCGIGGCNLPEQTVVAGAGRDLDRLTADMAANFPRKRALRLKTEGAFHTYLMVDAARRYREDLEAASFEPLSTDVFANYTGELHESDENAIRSRLFFQLFHPVRWRACMEAALAAGFDTVVELGGGIGRGDGPAGKRPNLESVVRRTLRAQGSGAEYFGAINAAGILAAARGLRGTTGPAELSPRRTER